MKFKALTLLAVVVLFYSIFVLGYQVEQSDFPEILIHYSLAFGAFAWIMHSASRKNLALWISLAFALRLILIPSFPTLSDDIYRFIWDGSCLQHGINPYSFLPSEIVDKGYVGLNEALFNKLNSKEYYSVYPWVNQVMFYLATSIDPENWSLCNLMLKTQLLLGESLLFVVLLKLLKVFNRPQVLVLLYGLNPLVIVEIMGNVHFEGLMAAFILCALLAIYYNKGIASGISLSFGIATKLLPLMFLPALVFRRSPWLLAFVLSSTIALGLLFYPIIDGTVHSNFLSSIDLYFRSFEFNGGIYYLLRWVGWKVNGYNAISFIGPFLAVLSMLSILVVSWYYRKNSLTHIGSIFILLLTIHFCFSTTVHPWYIITLVALSPLSIFRYPILWSYLVIWSYHAYADPSLVKESSLVLAAEYIILGLTFIVEFRRWKEGTKSGA